MMSFLNKVGGLSSKELSGIMLSKGVTPPISSKSCSRARSILVRVYLCTYTLHLSPVAQTQNGARYLRSHHCWATRNVRDLLKTEIIFADHAKHSDLKRVIETTRLVYTALWEQSSPPTPTNEYIQSIIKEWNLEPDLVAFCSTFTHLLLLALPDVVDTFKGDVTELLTEAWSQHIESQDPSIWLRELWFTELTHLFVECGVQAPFVTLYSLHLQGSLDGNIAFELSTRFSAAGHSLQCT